jgi:hypothetical protein
MCSPSRYSQDSAVRHGGGADREQKIQGEVISLKWRNLPFMTVAGHWRPLKLDAF